VIDTATALTAFDTTEFN